MRLPLIADVLDTYRLRKATCAMMHGYAWAQATHAQPSEEDIRGARSAYLAAGRSEHWPELRQAMHQEWNSLWQHTLNEVGSGYEAALKPLRFRTPSLMAMLLHVPVDASERWLAPEHPSPREILTHAAGAQTGFDLDEDVGLWPAPLLAFAQPTSHAL